MRAKPQPSGRNGTGRPGAPAKSSRPGALPGPVVGVQHLGEGEVEAGLALLPDDGRVHLAAPEIDLFAFIGLLRRDVEVVA